jgi:choline dehydrogenase-like flavoprotein
MSGFLQQRFHDAVSALAYSLATPHAGPADLLPPYNDLAAFILRQHARLPDYLRAPLRLATLAFDAGGFHRRPPAERARKVAAWKNARPAFARDLIRYHESLATLALFSRDEPPAAPPRPATPSVPPPEQWCEAAVIGSGPGGSITACLLAESGYHVLLLEEGALHAPDSTPPFSRQEMELKYRHGGQTVAFGPDKIAYVEACCAGGGSEINSGLYHRTPPDVLEQWQKHFDVQELDEARIQPHFEAIERTLSVSLLGHAAPPASLKLHDGARRLGWQSLEVPRWFHNGARRSMTRTYLDRYLRTGSTLLSRTRAVRLRRDGRDWIVDATHPTGRLRIHAHFVFVCGGAVQTPALLLRSGIGRNIGRSLRLHPTAKIAARFPDVVNAADMGVPVHQVKQFAPRLSFGCSISSPAHLALGLLDHPQPLAGLCAAWPHMANYYVMITPEGRGDIRLLPGFQSPLVRYRLTASDHHNLADGLAKLTELLNAAGAAAVHPNTNLMTIHLFSSCPMGERKSACAADSFGRLHGCDNLHINDASLLCTAPGVNPQGTIMAIARRNTLHFISEHS